MFPQNAPQGFNTSAVNQQGTGLLGNQPNIKPIDLNPPAFNTTAPSSSMQPGVASMVKALKGTQ